MRFREEGKQVTVTDEHITLKNLIKLLKKQLFFYHAIFFVLKLDK